MKYLYFYQGVLVIWDIYTCALGEEKSFHEKGMIDLFKKQASIT